MAAVAVVDSAAEVVAVAAVVGLAAVEVGPALAVEAAECESVVAVVQPYAHHQFVPAHHQFVLQLRP